MTSLIDFLATLIIRMLRPALYAVVAVDADGKHDTVEIYTRYADAAFRREELADSGFAYDRISISSRRVLSRRDPKRWYGTAWKQATGWTRWLKPPAAPLSPVHRGNSRKTPRHRRNHWTGRASAPGTSEV